MRSDLAISIRRACAVILFDAKTYRYKSRRPGQAALEQRIKEICQTRVRFGYRRVHVLLRREGWEINPKKTYRIYKELGMQLRNKTPKRRVKAKLREDRAEAVGPNDVWAMDFVHDQLTTGRKIRVLTVVDTFSRYVPVPAVQLPGRGCGCDAGTGLQPDRLSKDDPCRSGFGVHLPRHGSVGLSAWRHARLLATGKTD